MTNPKWEIGRVKLLNGYDAIIDAINEDQEDWRYTGRVRSQRGIMISTGWHANGRYMYAETTHGYSLAPPPKKKVRVRKWINVNADGRSSTYNTERDAARYHEPDLFARLIIDIEVEEGQGL